MQWPFSVKSSNPLTKTDYEMGCLIEIRRQFTIKISSISLEKDEIDPKRQSLVVLAGGQGARWVGNMKIRFADGSQKSQFFICQIRGDNPFTAKVDVKVPPR